MSCVGAPLTYDPIPCVFQARGPTEWCAGGDLWPTRQLAPPNRVPVPAHVQTDPVSCSTDLGFDLRTLARERPPRDEFPLRLLPPSAKNEETQEKCAIKKISNAFDNPTDARRTLREIKLLRHLRHENIVALKDILRPHSLAEFNDVYLVCAGTASSASLAARSLLASSLATAA